MGVLSAAPCIFGKFVLPDHKFVCSSVFNYLHALHSTTTYNVVNLLNTIYSQFAYVQLQAGIRTSRDISMLIGFVTSEVWLFF